MKFAGDTKRRGIAITVKNWNVMKEELDEFKDWNNRNKVKFNSRKYKAVHLGSNDKQVYYKLAVISWKWLKWKKTQNITW